MICFENFQLPLITPPEWVTIIIKEFTSISLSIVFFKFGIAGMGKRLKIKENALEVCIIFLRFCPHNIYLVHSSSIEF